ncbi:hypothetical protein MRB53_040753 [Persea americana]|nr:hypothetical protein MRB53_040753 [Persea americana]
MVTWRAILLESVGILENAGASAPAEMATLEQTNKIIPRPADEVHNTAGAAPPSGLQAKGAKWSDEPPAYEAGSWKPGQRGLGL